MSSENEKTPLPPSNPPSLGTCHIRRAVLIRGAPDAQLAVIVGAPALDPAPGSDRARVARLRGDGDGVQACAGSEGRCACGGNYPGNNCIQEISIQDF